MGFHLTAACRLATAGPCHPGTTTRPGMSSITERQQGFTGIHPSQPSPHLWPPDGTRTLGLSPGLRTPLSRTQRRTPGRGRASALPEVTSSASLTSSDALTHHERHHVARTCEVRRRLRPLLLDRGASHCGMSITHPALLPASGHQGCSADASPLRRSVIRGPASGGVTSGRPPHTNQCGPDRCLAAFLEDRRDDCPHRAC
jgi:hypothetical protein